MNPMTPTFWLLLALLALVAEFFTGSLYLLIVAVALAVIGVAVALGAPWSAALVAGSLAAIAGVALLTAHRRRRRSPRRVAIDDPDLGQAVDILANRDGHGTVRYRGADWQADFEPADLPAGSRGVIAGRDGNRLKIVSPT